MTHIRHQEPCREAQLRTALHNTSSSARLQVALAAGTHPHPVDLEILLEQCAIEPDFFVRDMLTWALTRHDRQITVPRLLQEARSDRAQARSQSLHTLSKIGDPRGWSAITPAVLRDPDDEVARAAWRTSVGLVPRGEEARLAADLCSQLGRGDLQVQRSLSRALAVLGEVIVPLLTTRNDHPNPAIRTHAGATLRMLVDPEEGFEVALAEAERIDLLSRAPIVPEPEQVWTLVEPSQASASDADR